MKLAQKKLIIFDFDGTLIDSGPDLALAINHMLQTLKRATYSENKIAGWIGNGAQTLVKRALLGSREIDEEIDAVLFKDALSIFLDSYAHNVCVKTILYPNVRTTLTTLKKCGYTLAIVTNKPFAFIEPILKGLQIDKLFEYYIGGDSLALKKPDPEPLYHVCKQLNVSVAHSVMIGDSKNDIYAAKSAQMDSIGVTYGYNYGEDIMTYKPDIVVTDIEQILEVFS